MGVGVFAKQLGPTNSSFSLSYLSQPARLYEHVATSDLEGCPQSQSESRKPRKRDRSIRWWQDAKTTLGLRIFSALTAVSGIALFMSESKTIMAAVDEAVKLVVAEFHDPSHWSGNITGRILAANLKKLIDIIQKKNDTDLIP